LNLSRLVACALVLAALACGGRRDVYQGHGVVREVDVAAKQVVVEHEEIPGLMSAMTMSFDVPDAALLAQLAPGQHIDFELEVKARSFRIISARSGETTPGFVKSPSIASILKPDDPAPGFALIDQDGKPLSMADLRGKTLVVDFIYTRCPGPCPILTVKHVELQRALAPELRDRVRFVSISLDPANDSPEALTAYAKERGADLASWSFLTGPEAEVAEVVRRWGVGSLRAADGTIDHAVATFLVDGRGRIRERWLGLEHEVGELRDAISALANAA
jgi:protein SCO1/2